MFAIVECGDWEVLARRVPAMQKMTKAANCPERVPESETNGFLARNVRRAVKLLGLIACNLDLFCVGFKMSLRDLE